MLRLILLTGVLATAPLFSASIDPSLKDGELKWFSLTETKAEVLQKVGPPANVTTFGSDFEGWQYHAGNTDHHEYSHYFVFRRSTGRLISVTRAYEEEQNVDALFPPAHTAVRRTADKLWGARVCSLNGGRRLIAMGSTKPGERTSQLLLILDSELRYFHPWLAD